MSTSANGVEMGFGEESQRFVRRVRIRNYKSIGQCEIELAPLTVLVGRNGAGKSNFLDALRFVADGLQSSLDHAIKLRGGIDAVRRRSTGHPRNFAIQLDVELSAREYATYGFEVGSQPSGGFSVKQEQLRISNAANQVVAYYRRSGDRVEASVDNPPPCTQDRLYLVNAAGHQAFRGVYDALVAMGFYNLNPAAMKQLQSPDAGELLHWEGANIASVVGRLSADQPNLIERIKSYLTTIVPEISDFSRVPLGPSETLEFRQKVVGSQHPWHFYASSISDGTLRALGALVAVAQLVERKQRVRLVGIEEPETALHPAAAGALMDALREAACHTQVVVTTHSPDLIDRIDLNTDQLVAVQVAEGDTKLGPVDAASQKAIHEHLYSPGELLRMDQLGIDQTDLKRQEQMVLFDPVGEAT